jgi:hypothetical protein
LFLMTSPLTLAGTPRRWPSPSQGEGTNREERQ